MATPQPTETRINRGGAWRSQCPIWLRGANTDVYLPSVKSNHLGFRTFLNHHQVNGPTNDTPQDP